jgi:hypothetical protein
MKFDLGLPRLRRGGDFIFVVMDKFSNITHFIYYHKIDDATNIVNLFFREIVWLHEVSKSIVFDHDVKLFNYFWKVLWGKLEIKLLFSITYYQQILYCTPII